VCARRPCGIGVLILQGVLCASVAQAASPPRLRLEHLTVEEGLSHNWVQSIVKDSRGFIWLGTQDGLNRYDAGSFTTFQKDPSRPDSLPFSSVRTIVEDSRGRLWIGNNFGGGGLARYDRGTDRFRAFPPDGSRKAPSGRFVRAIVEDARGRVWIATDRGLDAYDPGTDLFTVYSHDAGDPHTISSDSVFSLVEDHQGHIWVGTNAGLDHLDPRSGRVERWPTRPDDLHDISHFEIWDLLEESDGTIWVATLGGGLHHLDPATGRETRYLPDPRDARSLSSDRVRCLASDGGGRLFVGTENGGLNILDTATGQFRRHVTDLDDPTSLSSMSIYALLLDDQGILWIGTFNGGLNILSPLGERFALIKARSGGLSDPHVSAVLEDYRGELWIGTDGGGLNRLDRRTGHFTHYRHDPRDPTSLGSDAILALYEDEAHDLWVGGWDAGLARFDRARQRFIRFQHPATNVATARRNNVLGIRALSSGELAIASYGGVDLFDRKTAAFTPIGARYPGAGEGPFYAVAEDAEGSLWLSGEDRVERIDRRSGALTRFQHDPNDPQSLGLGRAWALLVDSRDNVWVGTEGGLNVFAAGTRRPRRFTAADGLPDDAVSGILEDDEGSLWLATNRGLAKLVDGVRLPDRPGLLTFSRHDGLQGSEFRYGTAYRSHSGEMFFGGQRGLNAFFPEAIRENPTPPRVVLTGLRIFGRRAMVGQEGSPLARPLADTPELRLHHRQSMITIEFAALNYLLPQKNQYAYKLEGLDPGWIAAGTQRSATYTNLPPGDYVFRVRGSNNDGVWNEKGASLRIRVSPPFWRARWFLLLVAGLLGAGLAAVYRWRVRGIEAQRQHLERLVAARTAALQTEIADHRRTEQKLAEALERVEEINRVQNHFFANISHELRNPLTLILMPLEMLLAEAEDGTLRELLSVVRANALRLLRYINELLELARLDAGHLRLHIAPVDLRALAASVWESGQALAEAKRLEFLLDAPRETSNVFGDAHRLDCVITNLAGNALKFTPDGGRVEIRVRDDDSGVEVEVADTGPGIPEEAQPHVFDRFYQVDVEGRRIARGSGIGLALAKELAELHGGRLTVASTAASGATLTLWLPKGCDHFRPEIAEPDTGQGAAIYHEDRFGDLGSTPAPAPSPAPPAAPAAPTPDARPRWSPQRFRILVVEDQAEVRAFVRDLLLRSYDVLEAEDGERALAMLEAERPDLVLTDVVMPRRGGMDLCREIKTRPRFRSIPVIMLTGRVGSEAMLEAYGAGADDFIAKPFHPQLLLARIEAQLRLSTLGRSLADLQGRAAALAAEAREPLDVLAATVSRLAADGSDDQRDAFQEAIVDASHRLDAIVTRLWA